VDGPDGKQHIERDMGYDGYIQQLAAGEHVLFVDMANVEADRLEAAGPEKAALLFPKDHTHTSAEGAELNAQSVVRALRLAHSPLDTYLAKDLPPAITDVSASPTVPGAAKGSEPAHR
jgi:hypothetical protein